MPLASAPSVVLAALFDLSHPARYVHWHFFQMSVANLVVVLLMIAVFVVAILVPFPKRERER
jgi:type IV secretory pathway component VirB8